MGIVMIKKTLFALITVGVFNMATAEQASVDSVKQLLTLTPVKQLIVQNRDRFLKQIKPAMPMASDDFWQRFQDEGRVDQLLTDLVPAYQQRFSDAEIKTIIAFYQTPAGKKWFDAQPDIVQHIGLKTTNWLKAVAKDIETQYKAEYYKAP